MKAIIKRLKSKTHLFNSAMMVIFMAVQENIHFIQPVFGDKVYYAVALMWGIGGYILREVTTKPVNEK